MLLFVGTLSYGQDLIKVDVKVDTDKLIELIDSKDHEIKMLRKMLKKKREIEIDYVVKLEKAYKTIDTLTYYKHYYDHSKHVIGPRIIKKIELMIKP